MHPERQDGRDHVNDGPATGEGRSIPSRPSTRAWAAITLATATVGFLASYWLGLQHVWRDPLFVVPFLAVAAIAVACGATMSAKAGLASAASIAVSTIAGFGLGLEAGHSLEDPVIRGGYVTWVSGWLLVVPLAWLIGAGIARLWRRRAATMDREG
jgi:hypothetical protein